MKKTTLLLVGIIMMFLSCKTSNSVLKNVFSVEQSEMIMNADSLKPMRVFKITNKTDSLLLRKKSEYIKADPNDLVLQNLVKRLYSTVRDSMSLGLGIAAPQVGILKNIIWVQRLDKENMPFEVYLNPKIIEYSEEKQTNKEGCLSIPNRRETLNNRSQSIVIEYDTMEAEHKTETVEAFTAVIFQHEVDHLNGILYLDHLKKEVLDTKK
jgi:peptide deformylase